MKRMADAEVIVVGGGPVGLLLAHLLGRGGHAVLVLESNTAPAVRSMAIGITPPSLDILRLLELDEAFLAAGLPIREAWVHEERRLIGHLAFDGWSEPFPFILSLPQRATMELLRNRLDRWPEVRLAEGWRTIAVTQDRDMVHLRARNRQTGEDRIFTAPLVAACDGARGEMAAYLGLEKHSYHYRPMFVMGDFLDRSGLAEEAHLYFGPERPVESFPLPGGQRRWIVREGWGDAVDLHESLADAVTRLTGIAIHREEQVDESRFQPRWSLVRRWHRGRIALCGDAAHVMSPIGGQGMNTGFGDAVFLARAVDDVLKRRASFEDWMPVYEARRGDAFRQAARRAALGMGLGVMSGATGSYARRLLVPALLAGEATRRALARWFTMRSLPHPATQAELAMRVIERKRGMA